MNLKKSHSIDMLNGTLWNKILFFAIPIAASSILQQLFNSADLAVVGKFSGPAAVAAVGSNANLINLLINLFLGISVGSNVVIGNLLGQKKTEDIEKAVHTTILIAILSGFFLIFVGFFAARPILTLMGNPEDVIDDASIYLQIYFMGMPFIMLYNFGSAILRSKGDTKRPLYCLTASGVLNVILNLIFVAGLRLNVTGVALATLISNILCGVLILILLMKEDSCLRLDLKKLRIKKSLLLKMMKIGIPAGLQGMVFNFSNVIIQSAINKFQSTGMAGSAAALNYEFITFFVVSAFNQASVSFTAINFGAGKVKRCKQIFKDCLFFNILFVGILVAIFIIWKEFFIGLYTTDPEAMKFGIIRLLVVEAFDLIIITYELGASTMRAMGHSLLPTIETIFGVCGLRLIWCAVFFNYIYPNFDKYTAFGMLMAAYPVSWIITGTIVLTTMFIIRKKEFSRIKEPEI